MDFAETTETENGNGSTLKPLPLLQKEVQLLRAESTGLREELMRALVTSLHSALSSLETKVATVSATVDLLQSCRLLHPQIKTSWEHY